MLGAGERTEKAQKYHLEAVLGVLRREFRDRWLSPDDQFQLWDKPDHQLAIRTQRLSQGVTPTADFCFRLAQDLADQALKSLCQGRVRDIALVLVALAGREKAPRSHQDLV